MGDTNEPSSRGARFWAWAKGWIFTTNHKRIGILYLWVTFLWFLLAGLDGMAIRLELATPEVNLWKPDLYNGLFTVHGTQMMFLFAIPVFSAFGNIFLPPMVGAKDMAFPKLNALTLWLVFFAGVVLRLPLVALQFPAVGWTNYVPQSNAIFTPTLGGDWWIWAVLLETIAATLGALNFLVTALRERNPDLRIRDMRPFVWAIEATSVLALLAGPFLIAALLMLFSDRFYGTLFFDVTHPEGTLLWQHIFWFYSHPATYIMILPTFGIISEIIPAFSGRRLYSRGAFLFGLWGTTILALLVWWHHMFVTGQKEAYSIFAMVMTFGVVVPTGVLFLNLLATLYKGRVQLASAMLFALGMIGLFTIGGIDGVYMAVIPVDWQFQDTYWLVAHIHFVLFGGTLMGTFAAVYYWFPEMFGRRLDERLGKLHFWGTVIGAIITFLPMHQLGVEGMIRRVWEYPDRFALLNMIATGGSLLIALAQLVFLYNVVHTLARTGQDDPEAQWPHPPGERPELTHTGAKPITPPTEDVA